MSSKKFRWSQVYESSEEELVTFLESRGVSAERIHAEAGDEPVEQSASSATTIWCAEGSLLVITGSGKTSLQPGDALRLEANTTYSIQAGIANCAYYLSR